MTRHNGTTAGFGFSAGINGGATNLNELGCVWNNGAAANYHSGLCVSNGVWSMVALVVSPTNLTFYSADTDSGIRSSTIAVNTINEAWAGPATIGYDDTMGLDRLLNGYIDEVAVFKRSLSAAEIGRLWMAGVYNSVVQLPIITQQPKPDGGVCDAHGVFQCGGGEWGDQYDVSLAEGQRNRLAGAAEQWFRGKRRNDAESDDSQCAVQQRGRLPVGGDQFGGVVDEPGGDAECEQPVRHV